MFVEESVWIRNTLTALPIQAEFQVLDIGSSNLEYRTKSQPHIYEYIFKPIEARGGRITCLDIKSDKGVDLILDLTAPCLPDEVFREKYDLVICCNILEHVADRAVFIGNVVRFVKERGFILLTAPHKYFRHNDPIDTMYRPSTKDLCDLLEKFTRFRVISEANIRITEKKYYIFPKGRLLDHIPFRSTRHLWRYYLEPFRWEISGVLVEALSILQEERRNGQKIRRLR